MAYDRNCGRSGDACACGPFPRRRRRSDRARQLVAGGADRAQRGASRAAGQVAFASRPGTRSRAPGVGGDVCWGSPARPSISGSPAPQGAFVSSEETWCRALAIVSCAWRPRGILVNLIAARARERLSADLLRLAWGGAMGQSSGWPCRGRADERLHVAVRGAPGTRVERGQPWSSPPSSTPRRQTWRACSRRRGLAALARAEDRRRAPFEEWSCLLRLECRGHQSKPRGRATATATPFVREKSRIRVAVLNEISTPRRASSGARYSVARRARGEWKRGTTTTDAAHRGMRRRCEPPPPSLEVNRVMGQSVRCCRPGSAPYARCADA